MIMILEIGIITDRYKNGDPRNGYNRRFKITSCQYNLGKREFEFYTEKGQKIKYNRKDLTFMKIDKDVVYTFTEESNLKIRKNIKEKNEILTYEKKDLQNFINEVNNSHETLKIEPLNVIDN